MEEGGRRRRRRIRRGGGEERRGEERREEKSGVGEEVEERDFIRQILEDGKDCGNIVH